MSGFVRVRSARQPIHRPVGMIVLLFLEPPTWYTETNTFSAICACTGCSALLSILKVVVHTVGQHISFLCAEKVLRSCCACRREFWRSYPNTRMAHGSILFVCRLWNGNMLELLLNIQHSKFPLVFTSLTPRSAQPIRSSPYARNFLFCLPSDGAFSKTTFKIRRMKDWFVLAEVGLARMCGIHLHFLTW